MIILAIETSCDDTSLAIFRDDKLIVMDTISQIKIHQITSWVVPEVAAREHSNAIFEVFENILQKSSISISEIDYIWVTTTPGLMPSLLTWITFAKTMWVLLNKPVLEINHITWHIFSNFLDREEEEISFPLVCLTVSWWHNDIYYMSDMWNMELYWTSLDDAAGESYDKLAKMMWLWYPWWPIISELASKIENINTKHIFPRVWLDKSKFDFSFSWLKRACKREIDERIKINWELTQNDKIEISYEFQNAVNEVLAYKLISRAISKNVKTIMLAWWVSANFDLRDKILYLSKDNWLNFIYPKKNLYCMDNAAMIGILTYYKIKYKKLDN